MPANRILILFAHPALQKSRVNRLLIDGITNIEEVTFHDLYQKYPEMDIDVKYEQELLIDHDIIVFHHPFFWYSTPAILKEWQDLVLEHGWAYGSRGNALERKIFFNVTTTGGKEAAYREDGYNRFTIRQLLAPIEQTARLCKMIFLPPFVVHGTHSITKEEIIIQRDKYFSLLKSLVEGSFEIQSLLKMNRLNDSLHS